MASLRELFTGLSINKITFFIIILSLFILPGSALECYVCHNQDGNYDKCVKTVKTCDQFQDWCLSTVKWGSLPYWQQGAPKMYYISKQCATKDMCVRAIRDRVTVCDRIWYNDWECAECCQGDRCNYYITLGASTATTEVKLLILSISTALFYWYKFL